MKKTKRILIVEDDTDLLDLYVELLTSEGYKVTQANNGEVALETLRKAKTPFDLLLIDEIIPKIKGTELIKLLKDTKDILKPKNIILMTNLDEASIEAKIKESKCTLLKKYIIKSELTPMDFIDEVNKVF